MPPTTQHIWAAVSVINVISILTFWARNLAASLPTPAGENSVYTDFYNIMQVLTHLAQRHPSTLSGQVNRATILVGNPEARAPENPVRPAPQPPRHPRDLHLGQVEQLQPQQARDQPTPQPPPVPTRNRRKPHSPKKTQQ